MQSRSDFRLTQNVDSHDSAKMSERVAIRTVSVLALPPSPTDDISFGARSTVRQRKVGIVLIRGTHPGQMKPRESSARHFSGDLTLHQVGDVLSATRKKNV